jgi:tetratricopeptide (TPR) repeat protein
LEHDNNADVATLLGYASRKLGRYDDAKYWYDKALAADSKHALTWSYYGMWHAEQGNLLKAKDDLEQVRLICGTECKEYVALKEVNGAQCGFCPDFVSAISGQVFLRRFTFVTRSMKVIAPEPSILV